MVSREDPQNQPRVRDAATAVAEHPLWSVVRRRQPDIDLILLPPERPQPDQSAVLQQTESEVRAEVDRLADVWRRLATLVPTTGDFSPPSVSWRAQGDQHALVVQKAVRAIGQEAGTELLRSVAGSLAEVDWRFVAGSRRGMPVLRAVDRPGGPHLLLHAEAGPGATVLTLRTRPMTAAPDVRSLIAAEVRSWQ